MNDTKKAIANRLNLRAIRNKIAVPKNNKSRDYAFRTISDIYTFVKPLLVEYDLFLDLGTELIVVSDRIFMKATASIYDKEGNFVASADGFAENSDKIASMSKPQITGAITTYAVKLALDTVFQIGNWVAPIIKDPDAVAPQETVSQETAPTLTPQQQIYGELIRSGHIKDGRWIKRLIPFSDKSPKALKDISLKDVENIKRLISY